MNDPDTKKARVSTMMWVSSHRVFSWIWSEWAIVGNVSGTGKVGVVHRFKRPVARNDPRESCTGQWGPGPDELGVLGPYLIQEGRVKGTGRSWK